MNKDSLLKCSFDKILSKLSSYCCLEYRRNIYKELNLEKIDFFDDRIKLENNYALIDLLIEIFKINKKTYNNFLDISDILEYNESNFIELEGLSRIKAFLNSAKDLQNFINNSLNELSNYKDKESINSLKAMFDYDYLASLNQELSKYIDDQGKLKEDSIPSLKSIKKSIFNIEDNIFKESNNYIKNNKDYFALDRHTIKDDRIVLAMKASYKNKIDGFVVSSSNSKSTVYVEPIIINRLNNDLILQKQEYKREIFKILRELNKEVFENLDQLRILFYQIDDIDILLTKALYSLDNKYNRINLENGYKEISCINALNPLINDAIGINITFLNYKVILLSGANAGGKTVALKLLALLSYMLKLGLFLPVNPDSMLPLFDKIFIELGDDQDIDKSLSSFTAHLNNINKILNISTEKSLILIDEICGSTSPKDGEAIAKSIIEELLFLNRTTFITTHFEGLKHYAFLSDKVMNASVIFDKDQAKPLFRINFGSFSESFALFSAKKVGMHKKIIQRASKYLESQISDFDRTVLLLEKKRIELDALLKANQELNQELTLKEQKLNLLDKNLKEEKLKLQELENYLKKDLLKEYREELKRRIKDTKNLAFLNESIKIESDELNNIASKIHNTKIEKQKEIIKFIKPGSLVKIKNTNKTGTIIQKNKDETFKILLGIMKIDMFSYEFDLEEKINKKEKLNTRNNFKYNRANFKYDLDLRGYNLEEAINEIENQIDKAIILNVNNFNVIHGKGDGILKNGIHTYLKRHNLKYSLAREEDGGWGKTYIYI